MLWCAHERLGGNGCMCFYLIYREVWCRYEWGWNCLFTKDKGLIFHFLERQGQWVYWESLFPWDFEMICKGWEIQMKRSWPCIFFNLRQTDASLVGTKVFFIYVLFIFFLLLLGICYEEYACKWCTVLEYYLLLTKED